MHPQHHEPPAWFCLSPEELGSPRSWAKTGEQGPGAVGETLHRFLQGFHGPEPDEEGLWRGWVEKVHAGGA
ncbi:MAG TPA: hypothetical protein VFV66_09430 [Nonomuraea sp.]|nr:hypothetical protein [Nonomuraea sp.]